MTNRLTTILFLGTSLLVTFWAMPKSNNKKPISYYNKGFVIFFAEQKNRQTPIDITQMSFSINMSSLRDAGRIPNIAIIAGMKMGRLQPALTFISY